MNSFSLKILAAEHRFYDGLCESIVINSPSGKYGVQSGHCKSVMAIAEGLMHFVDTEGKRHDLYLSDGMLETNGEECIILVDWAEYADEIEEKKKKREEIFKEEERLVQEAMAQYDIAEVQLKRILNKNSGSLEDDVARLR